MVSMSTAWDRTAEVLAGRTGMLAVIAGLLVVVPRAAQAALVSAAASTLTPATPGSLAAFGGLSLLVNLIVFVLGLWASLALVAASIDPAVQSAAEAMTGSVRRLGALVGVTLLFVIAVLVLAIPLVFFLAGSGINLVAFSHGDTATLAAAAAGGALRGALLYLLVILAFALWLSARLFLLVPVMVNERLAFSAVGRSFALTRGLTWRLVGVFLLFLVVAGVAGLAVQGVVRLLSTLVLGGDAVGTVSFVTLLANTLVSAAFAIVINAFTAQLYRLVTDQGIAAAFE